MIHIIVGTKAQLIKMAPVMRRLMERGIDYNYISTGQHRGTMREIHEDFHIPLPHYRLYDGPDITSVPQMLRWSLSILGKSLNSRAAAFRDDKKGIVLVHGDTFSTLLGALLARLAGLKVGHVESGLRSYNLWQPVPEELLRLATFRFSQIYFCPNHWASGNLSKHPGTRIDTGGNTLIDALNYAYPIIQETLYSLNAPEEFGIVTLHRYENIQSKTAIMRLIEAVERVAERHYLLFILHKPTEIRLAHFQLDGRLRENRNIELRQRYDYFDFMRLLLRAKIVVSDGGSNQEECAYLGKPVLLLREATERIEGIGENVVLSRFDAEVIAHFRDNFEDYAKMTKRPDTSPSDIIIDACESFA